MSLVLVALAASLVAIQEGDAFLVESPHFTIITDSAVDDAVALASTLETIRLVFLDALPGPFVGGHIDPKTPVVVHAISNEAGKTRLLPSVMEDPATRKPRALYRPGPDKHYLVLPLEPAHSQETHAFHEYSHLLTRVHWGPLPLWLDEGFAAFWETTVIQTETVVAGVPHQGYLETLAGEAPLPLPALMVIERESEHYTRDTEANAFYAQSWALVHYLLLGDTTGERRRQLFDYIGRLSNGQPEADALSSFGDLETLQRDAAAYLRQPRFRMAQRPRPPELPRAELKSRVLQPAEELAYVGDFVVHGDAPLRAESLLVRAVELDARLTLAHEGLGFLALVKEDTPAAFAAFSRAAELGSTSHLAHYYQAVSRARDGAETTEILESLSESLELNPDFAPAHRFVAAAVATRGEPFTAGIASAHRAIELEPSSAESFLALGRLQMLAGDEKDGVVSLRRALSLVQDGARTPLEIGRLFSEASRFAEAAVSLERAVELEPNSGALHHALGRALEAGGRFDDAVEHFRIARELGYVP